MKALNANLVNQIQCIRDKRDILGNEKNDVVQKFGKEIWLTILLPRPDASYQILLSQPCLRFNFCFDSGAARRGWGRKFDRCTSSLENRAFPHRELETQTWYPGRTSEHIVLPHRDKTLKGKKEIPIIP